MNDNQTIEALNVYRTYYPDPPGGMQEAIRQICSTTTQHGVNNRIFTLTPESSTKVIKFPEAEVVRERSWLAPASCDIGGIAAINTFKKLAASSDLIHYYHPWPFADLLNIITRVDTPKVLTYVSDVVRQKALNIFYSPLMWKNLQAVDIIVANCPAYAETSSVLTHSSIREKVRIIPLGIDESTYSKNRDDSVFERLCLVNGEPFFLFLGVLRYYKGLDDLIEAAKQVRAKIVIAGSGPESLRLKQKSSELGLNNIIFAGQVSHEEKISLLSNCSALILPSHLRSEAYGMVLVESSMFEKPMISCEIGTGTSYINQHNITGFVVPPQSPQHLSNAINELLNNPADSKMMGKAARLRYEALFSGKALGQAYASLYRDLL